jgi:flavodoxin
MSKLLIYYSLTGSGELVAKKFEEKGYEIRKVSEKKKMPKKFFFMVLSGGFRAGMGLKGKLVDYNNDVSSYEEVVIGSPIWNGRMPPVINSVLAQTDFSNKKLTFVFYSGSGEGKPAEKKVKKLFPDAKILFLKEPKKYEKELEKLGNLQ